MKVGYLTELKGDTNQHMVHGMLVVSLQVMEVLSILEQVTVDMSNSSSLRDMLFPMAKSSS
uniref:Uncharacterized protein n=1 Tax=Arion vulgaris TaxID=1028688 RepID=A0A0B6Z4G3_9EUPU